MAKLVPLEAQLKETVKGDVTVAKPKTGKVVAGKSTARVKKAVVKDGETKMECSRRIYNAMLNSPRKDVLLEFISQCGLTTAGASTYYSIHKKSAEE